MQSYYKERKKTCIIIYLDGDGHCSSFVCSPLVDVSIEFVKLDEKKTLSFLGWNHDRFRRSAITTLHPLFCLESSIESLDEQD